MVDMTKVDGRDSGKRVVLYALSTCVWCKKTKALLEELGINYEFVFVDLLEGSEREEAMEAVTALNPRCSFPTMSIDDRVIVGYKEAEIREAVE